MQKLRENSWYGPENTIFRHIKPVYYGHTSIQINPVLLTLFIFYIPIAFCHLRATASKYGESHDSSVFLLLRQKDPFGKHFSEIHFQSSMEFTFL